MSFTSSPTALGSTPHEARVSVDQWFTPLRFGLVLALLVFIAYPDVASGSKTFVFRDFGLFGYPLAHYYRESFWRR